MDPILCYTNAAAAVTYVPGNNYVQVVWTDSPTHAPDVYAVYLEVLHAMRHYQVCKTLSDHRLRPSLPRAVREWVVQYWIPRAILEANHSHAAIITTSPPEHRLIALFTPLAHCVQTRYFFSVEAGLSWLQEQV